MRIFRDGAESERKSPCKCLFGCLFFSGFYLQLCMCWPVMAVQRDAQGSNFFIREKYLALATYGRQALNKGDSANEIAGLFGISLYLLI